MVSPIQFHNQDFSPGSRFRGWNEKLLPIGRPCWPVQPVSGRIRLNRADLRAVYVQQAHAVIFDQSNLAPVGGKRPEQTLSTLCPREFFHAPLHWIDKRENQLLAVLAGDLFGQNAGSSSRRCTANQSGASQVENRPGPAPGDRNPEQLLRSFRWFAGAGATCRRSSRPRPSHSYCGSPTFLTNSANRGSERMGSSKNSVFKPSSQGSRS